MHDPGNPHAPHPHGAIRRSHEAEIVRLEDFRRGRPLARLTPASTRPPLAWYDRVE